MSLSHGPGRDRLHSTTDLSKRIDDLSSDISKCLDIVKVAYEDPDRGRDIICVREYLERVGLSVPHVETWDPDLHLRDLVRRVRWLLEQQEGIEALEIDRAFAGDDHYGLGRLRKKLGGIEPVVGLLDKIQVLAESHIRPRHAGIRGRDDPSR